MALAKWNRDIQLAAEDLQTALIDPASVTPAEARTVRREFSSVKPSLATAQSSLKTIETHLKRIHELPGTEAVENVIAKTTGFLYQLTDQLRWLESDARSDAAVANIIASCEAVIERVEIERSVNSDGSIKRSLGRVYAGVDTDTTGPLELLDFMERIDQLDLLPQIKERLKTSPFVESCDHIKDVLERIWTGLRSVDHFGHELQRFGEYDQTAWVGSSPKADLQDFTESLVGALEEAVVKSDELMPWSLYVSRRREAQERGLNDFVESLEKKDLLPEELAQAYAYCTYATITREAFHCEEGLRGFSGLKHSQIREEFQRLDKEIISLRGQAIAHECVNKANPPRGMPGVRVDEKSEMMLLNHLVPQQRPRMPVRKILSRAGRAIQALKPCFMMGPQAVAQYLAPDAVKFDLVIMDEASQLKPEEAIGAIARGGQLVVVGDPNQLPPTSFFTRAGATGEDEDQFTTTDAESILDVCSSHFRPNRALRWHYRSQHHSLIAFSNHKFYEGRLIIFPSPYGQGGNLGVRAVYLADAIYENQTNLREAKRVVDAVAEHIITRPHDSLGVVTLNIKQRDLIAELLEDRLRSVRGTDEYRERWKVDGQPLFVKNLENVQGDERDAIMISTTFGKPPGSNSVRQNFGPISRHGGWRRLNVLFTRAKKSVAVYTSLRPEDIVVDGTTPQGTKALRDYLEYARTGSLTVAEETGHEPDSDFEIAVMNMLRSRGYEVTPQLGVAGYRIDIAVKHPEALGSYLAAIECDGATYHSALSVRDRDRIRQEVLESMGWRGRIWRIWSTDWFRTPRQEAEKLTSFLEDLRRTWRPEHACGEAWVEEGQHAPPPSGSRSKGSSAEERQLSLDALIAEERDVVHSAIIDAEDDLEVEIGDVVKYVDTKMPEDILTAQITDGPSDFQNGVVNVVTPLAQILLSGVIGDEVTLHLPGVSPKVFKIIEIRRNKK